MMTYTISAEELSALWRRFRGFEPLRADCVVERVDAIDLDAVMAAEARAWYVDMLCHAPLDMLPVADITSQLAVAATPEGTATVILPRRVARLVSVSAEGWERSATIVTDTRSSLAVAQANPYARGGSARPVAVVEAGIMRLYSLPAPNARLTEVLAVMLPEQGAATFDFTPELMAAMYRHVTQLDSK